MPTLTAAFDRLLETQSSTSVDKVVSSPMTVPNSRPLQPRPIFTSKLERGNSTPSRDRKIPQMTPSLYATPNPTPLPDSPSSFSPSPYVINNKRRGPRLVKSSTVPDVSSLEKTIAESRGNGITNDGEHYIPSVDTLRDTNDRVVEDNDGNGTSVGSCSMVSKNIGLGSGSSSSLNGYVRKSECPQPNELVSEQLGKKKDFFELQESLSYASNTEGEDNGSTDQYSSLASAGEFFDAWEELSSESDHQPSTFRDIEKELREIRLSLLMEIEKRRHAEEVLTIMQGQWQRLRQELYAVGITLPAHPNSESEQLAGNSVDDLCQQVALARFVSEAIGRGSAKAEMEIKMEEQIEAKSFEITRLIDRLHYYEAMNQEMSQRNQESVERSRRMRQVRQRRQKWIWSSVAAAFSLGSAALLWSYYAPGKGESSSSSSADSQES